MGKVCGIREAVAQERKQVPGVTGERWGEKGGALSKKIA